MCDGNIYDKRGEAGPVLGTVIELESQPCAVVRVEKSIIVACMAKVVHSFHIGKTVLAFGKVNSRGSPVQRVRIFRVPRCYRAE